VKGGHPGKRSIGKLLFQHRHLGLEDVRISMMSAHPILLDLAMIGVLSGFPLTVSNSGRHLHTHCD
jgi:hypothetical protein